ncbi:hypothetical protein B0I35DRAFT_440174 [Stachybotrys elegans]|uniref:Uncharacterized protein n=1 Tax=Stachybotrys elegans TaxID=80388 RepID=A0A8K0SJ45_9HYPO|nr:hypothetical protein B0I35DRAFT_440174 [Stachybotrys elegans]
MTMACKDFSRLFQVGPPACSRSHLENKEREKNGEDMETTPIVGRCREAFGSDVSRAPKKLVWLVSLPGLPRMLTGCLVLTSLPTCLGLAGWRTGKTASLARSRPRSCGSYCRSRRQILLVESATARLNITKSIDRRSNTMILCWERHRSRLNISTQRSKNNHLPGRNTRSGCIRPIRTPSSMPSRSAVFSAQSPHHGVSHGASKPRPLPVGAPACMS